LAALAEARLLPALMAALNTVDLAHVAAIEVNTALLRPIDVFTQSWVVRKLARVQATKICQAAPDGTPCFGHMPGLLPSRFSDTSAQLAFELSGSCFGVSRTHTQLLAAAHEYGQCIPAPLSSAETLSARSRLVSLLGVTCPQEATPSEPSFLEPDETHAPAMVVDGQAEEVASSFVYEAPVGVDAETFFSLPEMMQRDIMLQHGMQPQIQNATANAAQVGNGVAATGDSDVSSYDPAVLAALPSDIRAEMLQAERRYDEYNLFS